MENDNFCIIRKRNSTQIRKNRLQQERSPIKMAEYDRREHQKQYNRNIPWGNETIITIVFAMSKSGGLIIGIQGSISWRKYPNIYHIRSQSIWQSYLIYWIFLNHIFLPVCDGQSN